MSMQTWSTYAYGVREDDIQIITTSMIWPVFQNIMKATNEQIFTETLDKFCAENGYTVDALTDEQIEDFIVLYYETHFNRVCPSAQALVLAELVAMNLRLSYDHVITEMNEDGDIIVGVGLYYPWETPDVLKNATQEDYEQAFINAYAILGIDGHNCDIDHQHLEDWG